MTPSSNRPSFFGIVGSTLDASCAIAYLRVLENVSQSVQSCDGTSLLLCSTLALFRSPAASRGILEFRRCSCNTMKAQAISPCPRHRRRPADTSRMQTAQSRRTYDHRVREAVVESGDRNPFAELEIPRSTIRSWMHRGLPDVVTSEWVTCDRAALSSEIRALRQRTALLAGVASLLAAMLRVSIDRVDYSGMPKANPRLRYRGHRARTGRVAAAFGASNRPALAFEPSTAVSRPWQRTARSWSSSTRRSPSATLQKCVGF